MVSVPCPLRQCDEVHEVRLDRSGNPFVACKTWRNSVWFRGVGESYLNANNGGLIRANPDPIEEPIAEESPAISRRTWPCKVCGAAIPEDSPRCPGCGDEVVWENPGGALQRAGQRVEGDVQRLFEKMRREVEAGGE